MSFETDDRRRTLIKTLGATGLASVVPGWARAAPNPPSYNVLWLMSDEQNPFVTGYGGDPFVRTPAIDSLAATGVQFSAAYTTNPICSPSRVGIHTGRFGSNIDYKRKNYESLGTYFTRQGFNTAWYGKRDWTNIVNNFMDLGEDTNKVVKDRFQQAGLEEPSKSRLVSDAMLAYWGTDLNEDSVTAEQAVSFLDKIGTKKFFLGVSCRDPHFPFHIQQQYYDLYRSAQIPEPRVTNAMLNDLSAAMKADRLEYGIADLTPEQTRFCRAVYYGKISYMDEQIGRVLNKLDAMGLRDNTIIIYSCDHGEMMGQHGIWYKNNFFEGSVRVPLVISLPPAFGPRALTKVTAPVNLIDVYPTLCELCGLRPPSQLEGTSLYRLMTGADNGDSREAFSENKRRGVAARMIRTQEYKYCWYDDGFEQLYDMQGSDRDVEAQNLAGNSAYKSVKDKLRKSALDGWNKRGLFDGGG